MRKIQLVLPFFLLFFFLFATNVHATFNVTYNVSVSALGDNARMIQCINGTTDNKIYCYVFDENSGSPSWTQKFYRFNSTLTGNNSCSLSANYTSGNCAWGSMILLNDSYMGFVCGQSAYDLWDISNISNSTCTLTSRTSALFSTSPAYNITHTTTQGAFGVFDNQIYTNTRGVIDKNELNKTLLYPPYYASSYDWGYGSKYANQISLPDKSGNSTIYVSEWGSSTFPVSPFYKYIDGYLSTIIDSPRTSFNVCKTNNTCYSDLVVNSTGDTLIYIFERATERIYMAEFSPAENLSYSCGSTSLTTIGTVCDIYDSNNRIYQTYDGCNVTYGSCPSGSVCSQLTPQINVSTSLVEDYVSCEIVTGFGFHVNCFNICFGASDIPVFSNCIDAGCKHCTIGNGNYTGYNINKWYTNQTSVSVPSYTIACIDTTTGSAVKIIDNLGLETNETDLLTKAGNSVSESPPTGTCTNSTTLCYDSVCNIVPCGAPSYTTNAFGWASLQFGSLFGMGSVAFIDTDIAMFALFLSLLTSMSIVIYLSMKTKSDNLDKIFGYSFLGLLSMFTIGLGNLLLWAAYVVLIVITAGIMTGYFSKLFGGS